MPVTKIDGSRQIKDASITNTQQAFGSPSAATDVAIKSYVDGIAQGLDTKASVRAGTTGNGALATAFANGQIIDGVTLATNDRILIKDQTTTAENGIYTVNATGSPTRATDADTNVKFTANLFVFVEEGTVNTDTGWTVTNNGAIVLGTTAIAFTQFSGAGTVVAGAGLTRTGTSLDVIGTANRIVVTADQVDIGTDVVTLTGTQTLTNKSISGGQITSAVANATAATTATTAGNVTGIVALVNGGTGQSTKAPAFDALSPMTTAGDIIIGGAAGTGTRLAAGATVGHVLTSTGTGSAPSWQTVPGAPIFVTRETPTGLVNSSNTTYTLANTPTAGSEEVFLNGILQEPGAGNDYTIAAATITYLTAPVTGDKIRVNYRR